MHQNRLIQKLFLNADLHCTEPEQLFQSETFAEFLVLFNKVRHQFRQLEVVIPQQVSRNMHLAEMISSFYNSLSVPETVKAQLDPLVEKCMQEVRTRTHDILSAKELVELPYWITSVCLTDEKPIPLCALYEMERIRQRELASWDERFYASESKKQRIVVGIMNNFYLKVTRRDYPFARHTKEWSQKIDVKGQMNYGPKMKSMTWEEFYSEIDESMSKKKLSLSELEGKDSFESSLYLLPLFLELLRRGYKVYPDLTV